MAALLDGLIDAAPFVGVFGVVAQIVYFGINRGWGAVHGQEALEQAAADARDRLATENDAFITAKHEVEDAEKQLEAVNQQIKTVTREMERIESRPPTFYYVLGKPGGDAQMFRAILNRDATAGKGKPLSPTWRYTNGLVIFAAGRDAARAMADHTFPEKAGYTVIFQN